MNKKRLVITSIISVILVTILMIGSTYSVFTTSDVDENSNVYRTGNLDVTYTLSEDNVQFVNIIPLAEEEANTVVPYRITVTNSGTVPYKFDLILSDTTAGEAIDYHYIMTKVGDLEAKSLIECTDNVIKEDVIVPANASVDVDVRVWISDKVSNDEIGNSFYAKLAVDGLAIYDDSEEIDNYVLHLNYMKTIVQPENLVIDQTENTSELVFEGDSYFYDDAYREKIKTVSFVNYINTTGSVASWDLSIYNDGGVMAWLTNNSTSGYYDLYIGSKNIIYAKSLSCFFYGMKYVDSIDFSNLDTALTQDMSYMFYETGYYSTTFTLDLGDNFYTKNVTNMNYMFSEVSHDNPNFSLDLGDNFDTTNAINMNSMFRGAGNLSTVLTVDLGDKFDTSNVTDMGNMFRYFGYSSTTFTLDLGDEFDTSNVTDMYAMFQNTGYSSTGFSLDLGNSFDTSNVTDMQFMFDATGYKSTSFTLDLGDYFNTINVTAMNYMFRNTGYSSTAFTLNLGSRFDTSNVMIMTEMFRETGHDSTVMTLDLGDKFDTSKVTDMSGMFRGAGQASPVFTLDLGDKFDTSSVLLMDNMFNWTGYANTSLTVDLSSFTFTQVTGYSQMFWGWMTTQKIYVKDATDQSWIINNVGNANLTTSNVLVKS